MAVSDVVVVQVDPDGTVDRRIARHTEVDVADVVTSRQQNRRSGQVAAIEIRSWSQTCPEVEDVVRHDGRASGKTFHHVDARGVGVDLHDEVVGGAESSIGSRRAHGHGHPGHSRFTRVLDTIAVEVEPNRVADAGSADVAEVMVEVRLPSCQRHDRRRIGTTIRVDRRRHASGDVGHVDPVRTSGKTLEQVPPDGPGGLGRQYDVVGRADHAIRAVPRVGDQGAGEPGVDGVASAVEVEPDGVTDRAGAGDAKVLIEMLGSADDPVAEAVEGVRTLERCGS